MLATMAFLASIVSIFANTQSTSFSESHPVLSDCFFQCLKSMNTS